MALYEVASRVGKITINLEFIESMKALPVMNEGDEEHISVLMVSGTVHVVSKLSLYCALAHSNIKVHAQKEEEEGSK